MTNVISIDLLFLIFSPDGKPPGFATKAALGMAAGVVGAFVGTPAEVILVKKAIVTTSSQVFFTYYRLPLFV